jgi:hypothetical protein
MYTAAMNPKCTAHEGPVRIQDKCLVLIYVLLLEMKLRASLFPKQSYNVLSPSIHILVSLSDVDIPTIGLPILLQPNWQTNPVNTSIAHRYMIVGIGNEVAQFHKSEFWYREGLQHDITFESI